MSTVILSRNGIVNELAKKHGEEHLSLFNGMTDSDLKLAYAEHGGYTVDEIFFDLEEWEHYMERQILHRVYPPFAHDPFADYDYSAKATLRPICPTTRQQLRS